MSNILYRLMYLFSKPRWDSGVTPPEVIDAFQNGQIPPGPVLDLGCGTGTNVIYMAGQGRKAIGLDFVPEAIAQARKKAADAGLTDQAEFHVADVTRLDKLDLPQIGFALDMGCFHSLGSDGRRAYASGLAALMIPGGRYLLYTLDPHTETGFSFGVSPDQVRETFQSCFDITHEERGAFWERGSTWFWLTRKK